MWKIAYRQVDSLTGVGLLPGLPFRSKDPSRDCRPHQLLEGSLSRKSGHHGSEMHRNQGTLFYHPVRGGRPEKRSQKTSSSQEATFGTVTTAGGDHAYKTLAMVNTTTSISFHNYYNNLMPVNLNVKQILCTIKHQKKKQPEDTFFM